MYVFLNLLIQLHQCGHDLCIKVLPGVGLLVDVLDPYRSTGLAV